MKAKVVLWVLLAVVAGCGRSSGGNNNSGGSSSGNPGGGGRTTAPNTGGTIRCNTRTFSETDQASRPQSGVHLQCTDEVPRSVTCRPDLRDELGAYPANCWCQISGRTSHRFTPSAEDVALLTGDHRPPPSDPKYLRTAVERCGFPGVAPTP